MTIRRMLFLLIISASLIPFSACTRRWNVLSIGEQVTLQRILEHWETWMPKEKKKGKAPLLTFKKLYGGLSPEEQKFLDRVRLIDPHRDFGFRGKYLGSEQEGIRFKRLKGQKVLKKGKREKLDPQYLPENVYSAYRQMMKAMKKDLGKILLVESGYRSPAYQLYTFLYYTPKHHYSLVEAGHWVALPGYSEHGAPHRQAIDFMNEEGVNGEDNVEDFERLPEYKWLLQNAHRFGFELSYQRGKKGITFEPWHWRYIGMKWGQTWT